MEPELAQMYGTRLGALVGLTRIGVNRVRVPRQEVLYLPFPPAGGVIFVVSGRAVAEIDGEEYEVSNEDFIGFTTPGVAHHLRNTYEEDLVYLIGGENHEVEVANFPHLGKRMLRLG